MLSQIRIDSPIAPFIGIGECGPFHRRSESGVIELPSMRRKADFDVAETFTSSQLGESHGEELFPAGQSSYTPIAVVAMNKSIKIVVRNELKQLSENRLPAVHQNPSRGMIPHGRRFFSNRLKLFSLLSPWPY
jgi:hypothetical protein